MGCENYLQYHNYRVLIPSEILQLLGKLVFQPDGEVYCSHALKYIKKSSVH